MYPRHAPKRFLCTKAASCMRHCSLPPLSPSAFGDCLVAASAQGCSSQVPAASNRLCSAPKTACVRADDTPAYSGAHPPAGLGVLDRSTAAAIRVPGCFHRGLRQLQVLRCSKCCAARLPLFVASGNISASCDPERVLVLICLRLQRWRMAGEYSDDLAAVIVFRVLSGDAD